MYPKSSTFIKSHIFRASERVDAVHQDMGLPLRRSKTKQNGKIRSYNVSYMYTLGAKIAKIFVKFVRCFCF